MGNTSDDPKPLVHILVVSIPAPGHLIPSTSLAHQLADVGAQVTYLSTGYVFEHLQHRGNHTYAPHLNSSRRGTPKIRFELLLESPEVYDLTLPKMMEWQQALSEEKMRVALERKFEQMQPKPCCIVADMLLGWVQDVADQFGVPRLALFTVPATDVALILRLPDLLRRGELPFNAAGATKKDIMLPGMASILADDVWGSLADGGHENHWLMVKTALRVSESAAIIVNTFEELEVDALKALRTDFVAASIKVPEIFPILLSNIPRMERPSFEASLRPKEGPNSEVEKWLDAQAAASVIYVSFGSLATIAEEDIGNLALALEASNYPFLWVYRPPGKPQVSCNTSKSGTQNNLGIDKFPPGFQERVSKRAMLYFGWAPQPQILTHQAVGAFLTHCGWNSALESICAGVPMLAWPIFADQKMNARVITNTAQVGLRIHRNMDGTISQEEIEKMLKQMMVGDEGKATTSNALKFKLLAQKNVAKGGTSMANLNRVVDNVHQLQCTFNKFCDGQKTLFESVVRDYH